MKKVKILLIIAFMVLFSGIILRISDGIAIMNVTRGIEKIGIVPVWLDNEEYKFIKKEDIIVEDKKTIHKIVSIINNGDIDRSIALDRMPAEYDLYFYYNDKEKVRSFYWINCSKYNLNIYSISGEITVNGAKLDEIIQSLAGENDRINIENPYY